MIDVAIKLVHLGVDVTIMDSSVGSLLILALTSRNVRLQQEMSDKGFEIKDFMNRMKTPEIAKIFESKIVCDPCFNVNKFSNQAREERKKSSETKKAIKCFKKW